MVPRYSLDLFKLLINQKPVGMPIAEIAEAEKEYDHLEKEAQTPEQVDSVIREFGKKAWPYIQAQNYFLENYGEAKRQEVFLNYLSEELKNKWQIFETKGGSLHNFRDGGEYEKYFTADEDHRLEVALIEANQKAKEYINFLATSEKKEEYNNLVINFQKEKEEIENLLEELRNLKKKSSKWSDEIENDIVFIQNGFAEMEERPTVLKTKERVEWYKGQIEGLS